MRKLWILGLILTVVLSFAGCQKAPVVEEPAPEPAVTEAPAVVVEAPVIEEPAAETGLKEGEVYSPLTGLPVEASLAENRPVVVMLDNQFAARPQSALIDAEIVYEILAEGRITRYMAVFQSKSPAAVGPIRSSRMYFIQKALEYDPLYVHVGGSPEALNALKTLDIGDVDGLKAGKDTFWRVDFKKIPHNMYSSMEALRKHGIARMYKTTATFDSWTFNHEMKPVDGDAAEQVKLVYLKPSSGDKVGYYATYTYDAEQQLYVRGVNGNTHLDETNSEALKATNVLIQVASHKVVDSYGRLDVDIIGQGKGYYLTMGKKIDVTWKKADDKALTRFYDADGNEVVMNPGITWVQVIDTLDSVTIE